MSGSQLSPPPKPRFPGSLLPQFFVFRTSHIERCTSNGGYSLPIPRSLRSPYECPNVRMYVGGVFGPLCRCELEGRRPKFGISSIPHSAIRTRMEPCTLNVARRTWMYLRTLVPSYALAFDLAPRTLNIAPRTLNLAWQQRRRTNGRVPLYRRDLPSGGQRSTLPRYEPPSRRVGAYPSCYKIHGLSQCSTDRTDTEASPCRFQGEAASAAHPSYKPEGASAPRPRACGNPK